MARYDKYDPINGGFRATIAADYPDSLLGAIVGVGMNSAGQLVVGAGQTGIIGVLVLTQKPGRVGPQREVSVVDVMQMGCVTDFGPTSGTPGVNYGAAGTPYYSDSAGNISSAATQSAQQQLTIVATGGTFTATFGGQTTSALAYNISASALQTALQGLSSIGSGNATVTSPSTGVYIITFAGTMANTSEAAITVNGASLTGTGASASVSQLEAGGQSAYVGTTIEPDRLQVHVVPLSAVA